MKIEKANTEIENQLPYNEYYDFFGPDYELVPNIINNRVSTIASMTSEANLTSSHVIVWSRGPQGTFNLFNTWFQLDNHNKKEYLESIKIHTLDNEDYDQREDEVIDQSGVVLNKHGLEKKQHYHEYYEDDFDQDR